MTDLTHIWHKFDLLDGSRVTHAPNGLCQNDTVFLLHSRPLNRSATMVVKIGNCVSQPKLLSASGACVCSKHTANCFTGHPHVLLAYRNFQTRQSIFVQLQYEDRGQASPQIKTQNPLRFLERRQRDAKT